MIHLLDKVAYSEDERQIGVISGVEYTIPNNIAKYLPKKCSCDFLYHVNDKLTAWYCPNPFCIETNIFKVLKVFEKAHARMNIGEAIARDIFYHNNNFFRHMDFVCIDNVNQIPPKYSRNRAKNWVKSLRELRTNITLSEYIYMFQLDKMGSTTCNLLFTGKTLDDIENKVDNELYLRQYIRKSLNLVNSYTDTEDEIVLNLRMHMNLFRYYSKYFTFKKEHGKALRICITGSITGFTNREELIPYISERYNITPILFNSVSRKIDYLIYEDDFGSNKMQRAKQLGKALHINEFWKLIEPYRKEKEEENEESKN